MSSRELDAAGIGGTALRTSYEVCRRLNSTHGRTYYLATLLLPPASRPAVHALYGFARYADDLVDDDAGSSPAPAADRARLVRSLDALGTHLDPAGGDALAALPPGAAAVLPAVRHALDQHGIDPSLVTAFLDSMRSDLTVTDYASYPDLERYMYGSAAAIGLQMLPVLGHSGMPHAVVAPYAVDLGVAFQLTNFIRDVGEDLRRGRIYLPADELAWFGVDRDHLRRGVVDGAFRRALAHQIARVRELYRNARPGIRLLDPAARDCIRTAAALYEGILDEVERADYQVFDRRVQVSLARRLRVAGPAGVRAARARSTQRRPQ